MSDQQHLDTGSGFITGADPRTTPLTQQDLQGGAGGGQTVPHVVINNGGQQGPQGQRVFTEEEVGAIRAEEKEKLYGRLTTMETELQTMRQEREEREAAALAAQQEAEEVRRTAEEAQMDVRQLLERKDQEWQTRFQGMEQERERDQAIFEQEKRFHELQDYRRDRIEQEGEWIFPELRDLVQGADPAEIDQSIEIMKQRTATIMQNVQGALVAQRGPIRGVAPTGAPPIGPMEQQTATQTLSVDDIRKMDPKTFGMYRDQLLGLASRAGPGGLNRNQAQQ